MRYSTSFIAATVISLLLFLGMSVLISTKNTPYSSSLEIPVFTMEKFEETPKNVKINKPTIPEKQEIKQPPAAPKVDIKSDPQSRSAFVPNGQENLKNLDLTGLDLKVMPNILTGHDEFSNSGELTQVIAIEPIYPPEAARAGIEGWVKVEIVVNKQGLVENVKILEASPKRIFNQATKKAILRSKFKPMIINGQPVAQSAIQTINFKLDL